MFNYFRSFNQIINLSDNTFNNLKYLNYTDDVLDKINIYSIGICEQVFPLVEDKSLLARFFDYLNYVRSETFCRRWIWCIFIEIDDFELFNDTFFLKCCEYGVIDIVEYLVENGFDLHVNDEQGLILAAQNGYIEVVKYLIENNADIHAQKEMALIEANRNGYKEIVSYLISKNADYRCIEYCRCSRGCICRQYH